ADAALLGGVRELDKIAKRAVGGIDPVVIGNVVTVVAAGGALKRHEPDSGDAEPMQIIKPPHQSLEIADAVAVRIHVGANRKAVNHGIFVPKVLNHSACGRARTMTVNGSWAMRSPLAPSARHGLHAPALIERTRDRRR